MRPSRDPEPKRHTPLSKALFTPCKDAVPVRVLNETGDPGLLLVCDHASPRVPASLRGLGLPAEVFTRHIAYDIGAAALTEALSRTLDAPAILAGVSRLVIDLNRGLDDPTLIMALSDGTVIPGNHPLAETERAGRIAAFHAPYHDAIGAALDRALARGVTPSILSIHSFTGQWRGLARPWQVGVLWNRDPRLALPLIAALKAEGDLTVGDNEPYTGALVGDCMDRHGTGRGLPHALLEVRQDLIDREDGVVAWTARLARVIHAVLEARDTNAQSVCVLKSEDD